MAELLKVARRDGQAEFVHLHTVVVDVKLLEHVIARMAHQIRRSRAQSSPATMAYMHRTGGVCGNILDVNLTLALGDRATAVIALFGANLGNHILQRVVVQIEIDEAGTCNFDFVYQGVLRKGVDDILCNFARIALGLFRAAHCRRACPVAMPLISGSLERDFGGFFHLKFSGRNCRIQGGAYELRQFFTWLHGVLPFRSSCRPSENKPAIKNTYKLFNCTMQTTGENKGTRKGETPENRRNETRPSRYHM